MGTRLTRAICQALAICLALAAATSVADAQPAKPRAARPAVPVPVVARDYLAALERYLHHDLSVGGLYAEAVKLRDRLMQPQGDGSTLLENLDPQTYLALASRLLNRGLVVNRDEVVFATVDASLFLQLAKKRGSPSDVAFFTLDLATYPSNGAYLRPAYVEQQTDFTGCTIFAGDKLVDLYGRWIDYRVRFPHDYQDAVADVLKDIAARFTDDTCACEDRPAVAAALKAFLARFPHDPIAPQVAARLHALDAGTSPIRFHCTPS